MADSSFLSMLLQNPNGWMGGPAISMDGPALAAPMWRTRAEAAADRARVARDAISQPDLDLALGTGQAVHDIGSAVSGIDAARDAGRTVAEGVDAGDPMKAAGGLVQGGLAALPMAGRLAAPLVKTAPRLAAMLMAGGLSGAAASGALSSSPAQAGDNSKDPLPGLYADRERISQQIDAATATRDREARTGRGPNWQAADSEVQRLSAQKAGLDQMIQRNEEMNSPEHAQDVAQRQKEIDDANAKAKLDKPFQERFPEISTALVAGAPVLSGVLSAYGLGKVASKGQSLLADMLKARESGDIAALAEKAAALDKWNKWAPVKQAAAIAVPATAPADARVIGDVIDKYSLPSDSKAQNAASERLGDPAQYAKDALPALASGLIWSGIGSKVAPSAPRDEAKGMLSIYGGKDAPSLADYLKQASDATASVQGPIGRAQTARRVREAGDLPSDSGSGARVPDSGTPPPSLASQPQLPPPSDHHSSRQPRNKKGRFSGPPLDPDND